MTTLSRFDFYSDLQAHIGKLFDRLVSDASTSQKEFWKILKTEWIDRLPEDATLRSRYQSRAEAFTDGLLHNFSRLAKLETAYLVEGVWVPLSECRGDINGKNCRLTWKKTGAVYGEIDYGSPKPRLTLEKAYIPQPESESSEA